jgi:hypothetical protein
LGARRRRSSTRPRSLKPSAPACSYPRPAAGALASPRRPCRGRGTEDRVWLASSPSLRSDFLYGAGSPHQLRRLAVSFRALWECGLGSRGRIVVGTFGLVRLARSTGSGRPALRAPGMGWHPVCGSRVVGVPEGGPVVGVLLAVCLIQAGPSISPSRGQPELTTGRCPPTSCDELSRSSAPDRG